MAFHREIAWISGNPIYPAIVEAPVGRASACGHSIVPVPGAESLTLAEHQHIIDATAQGHAGEAAICCI